MPTNTIKTVRCRAFWGLCSLLLFAIDANGHAADAVFRPGEVWRDTSGKPINAHGGGMLFHGGTYYWYGENKEGRTWLPESTKAWDGYRVDVTGIRCYSSKDLLNWKDEGLVLKAVPGDAGHDLHPSKVCERPKVVFNPHTRKFVMWMHIDSENYKAARAGVAVAENAIGPFTYLQSIRPEGQDSRDQTLFQDDDGKAYRIYSSENNDTTYISLLSDDYLRHTGKFTRVFEKRRMEAPAMFKHAGKYWFIGSDCTGWDPNAARSAVADSIWGPWKELGNPCRGPGAAETFGGQSAFVFPVAGKKDMFIFMADRWNKTRLDDSRYLWLPLEFQENKPVVKWMPTWGLSRHGVSAGALQAVSDPLPTKNRVAPKGVGNYPGVRQSIADMNAMRVGWYYDWGTSPVGTTPGIEFVPMIWAHRNVNRKELDAAIASGAGVLLGFNEPDARAQSNMTVAQAIADWPQLQATGLRLGSPATGTGDDTKPGGWLARFMAQIKARGYRVDFICIHPYQSNPL